MKKVLWTALAAAVANFTVWTVLLVSEFAGADEPAKLEKCPSDHVYQLVWTGRTEYEAGKAWYIMSCPLGHEFRRESPR